MEHPFATRKSERSKSPYCPVYFNDLFPECSPTFLGMSLAQDLGDIGFRPIRSEQ